MSIYICIYIYIYVYISIWNIAIIEEEGANKEIQEYGSR